MGGSILRLNSATLTRVTDPTMNKRSGGNGVERGCIAMVGLRRDLSSDDDDDDDEL